jgi:predicted membrane channel-forming protein YqfA (hemolysin III family)
MKPFISLAFKEQCLLLSLAALTLFAVVGHIAFPLTPYRAHALLTQLGLHAHVGGNCFADTRAWLGIPNAIDVLSNVPFAVFGLWGVFLLSRCKTTRAQRLLLQVFFAGLLLTSVGSMTYHLIPNNDTLLWDRAGMAVAFAGVLGLAASERVSERAGRCLALLTLLFAGLALWVWQATGDVLPWGVLQFGGMAVVIGLAFVIALDNRLGVSLWALIAFYGVAKVLESADHAVFEATGNWISGHSLKHVMASLAALPVLLALRVSKKLINAQPQAILKKP